MPNIMRTRISVSPQNALRCRRYYSGLLVLIIFFSADISPCLRLYVISEMLFVYSRNAVFFFFFFFFFFFHAALQSYSGGVTPLSDVIQDIWRRRYHRRVAKAARADD